MVSDFMVSALLGFRVADVCLGLLWFMVSYCMVEVFVKALVRVSDFTLRVFRIWGFRF